MKGVKRFKPDTKLLWVSVWTIADNVPSCCQGAPHVGLHWHTTTNSVMSISTFIIYEGWWVKLLVYILKMNDNVRWFLKMTVEGAIVGFGLRKVKQFS